MAETPKEIRTKWEEGFSEQISDTVNNIIFQNVSQNSSPVMEMFQLIALNEFCKDYLIKSAPISFL